MNNSFFISNVRSLTCWYSSIAKLLIGNIILGFHLAELHQYTDFGLTVKVRYLPSLISPAYFTFITYYS